MGMPWFENPSANFLADVSSLAEQHGWSVKWSKPDAPDPKEVEFRRSLGLETPYDPEEVILTIDDECAVLVMSASTTVMLRITKKSGRKKYDLISDLLIRGGATRREPPPTFSPRTRVALAAIAIGLAVFVCYLVTH